jgi:DNA mismatch repair protein MutH
MQHYDKTDAKSIERFAQQLLGKSLSQVISSDSSEAEVKGKGCFGQVLERDFFGINPGNKPEPDFPEAQLELKSFPLIKTGKGIRSKERISLGMIDYMSIPGESWENSSFLAKNSHLLLVAYLFDKNIAGGKKAYLEFIVRIAEQWNYPKEDLEIIRQDWTKIHKKVSAGEAHLLSEGDTLYLGAATKGVDSSKLRKQPHGPAAKPRSLTLKQSYVNIIVERLLRPHEANKHLEPAVNNGAQITDGDFEDYIIRKFNPYIGKTTDEINATLNVVLNPNAKNYMETLTRAILGVRKAKIEEFEKAGIVMKTIRLEKTGLPKESMSFPHFKYQEIIKESWDESSLKQLFEKKFFFIVFRRERDKRFALEKVMFWNMPMQVLDGEVQKVWRETRKKINEGDIDHLPSQSQSFVCHVRPHGRNAGDVILAPNGNYYVKKCFWLNRGYISKIINSTPS